MVFVSGIIWELKIIQPRWFYFMSKHDIIYLTWSILGLNKRKSYVCDLMTPTELKDSNCCLP